MDPKWQLSFQKLARSCGAIHGKTRKARVHEVLAYGLMRAFSFYGNKKASPAKVGFLFTLILERGLEKPRL
jgi:hypothetical protein